MNKKQLDDFFTFPEEYFLEIPKNFDTLIDRGSDTLVITFGDSWTWGGSLHPTERKSVIFGNIVSEKLNCDYKNVSLPSMSNRWIVNQLKKFHDAKLTLPYNRIILIVMLTEMCREFNTKDDLDTNYVEELKNSLSFADVIQTLSNLNSRIILDSLIENTQLIVGRTYTCNLYRDLSNYMIPDSWLDLLCDANGFGRVDNVYALHSWALEKIKDSTNFINIDKNKLIEDITNSLEASLDAITRLENSKLNMQHQGYKHPNAQGHKLWADHILKFIK